MFRVNDRVVLSKLGRLHYPTFAVLVEAGTVTAVSAPDRKLCMVLWDGNDGRNMHSVQDLAPAPTEAAEPPAPLTWRQKPPLL
jgi:hypothetical protein